MRNLESQCLGDRVLAFGANRNMNRLRNRHKRFAATFPDNLTANNSRTKKNTSYKIDNYDI